MTDIINNNGSITENKSNELVFVQNAGLVNNTVARIAGGKRIFAVVPFPGALSKVMPYSAP